jgi:hypothetical protein
MKVDNVCKMVCPISVNTLLTQAVQAFAREQAHYTDSVAQNWNALVEAVEGMPLE